MKLGSKITLLGMAVALAGGGTVFAGQTLELPPPPSSTPPSIDMAMLSPAPAGDAALNYALLPAQAVEDETLYASMLPTLAMPTAGMTATHPALPPMNIMPMTMPAVAPARNIAMARGRAVAAAQDPALGAILNDLKEGGDARAKLEATLVAQLRERLPEGGESLIIEGASIPNVASLPAEGWTPRFRFRMPQTATGQVSYNCEVRDAAGRMLKQFSGAVRLDREVRAIQAVRPVSRGEIISEGDLQSVPARLSELPAGTLQNADLAVGASAAADLKTYQWVGEKMLRKAELLTRNTPVRVTLKRGGLTLTTPGIAMQGGAAGDVIRVINAESKKEVFARILTKDEVQVAF